LFVGVKGRRGIQWRNAFFARPVYSPIVGLFVNQLENSEGKQTGAPHGMAAAQRS
jgi:hypothetical protein